MKTKILLLAFICGVFCNKVAAQNDKKEEIQNAKEQYENGIKTWQPQFYGDHQEWKLLDENKGENFALTTATIDTIQSAGIPACAKMKYSNGPAFLKQAPQTITEIIEIEKKNGDTGQNACCLLCIQI